jgi:hypothetical protein
MQRSLLMMSRRSVGCDFEDSSPSSRRIFCSLLIWIDIFSTSSFHLLHLREVKTKSGIKIMIKMLDWSTRHTVKQPEFDPCCRSGSRTGSNREHKSLHFAPLPNSDRATIFPLQLYGAYVFCIVKQWMMEAKDGRKPRRSLLLVIDGASPNGLVA